MAKLILFGNGQVATHIHYHFSQDSDHQVVAFTVDRAYMNGETLLGLPVVPFEEVQERFPPEEHYMHVSISYRQVNRLRAEKYEQAKGKGYRLVNLISSRATTWKDLAIGDNCLIGANTNIDAYVEIGNDVHIAGGCTVGHHTNIGDHCFLAAGVVVSGSVTIEPYCFLGAGSVIRDRVRIAAGCVIGAGAVILEDTVEKGVYLGKQADLLPIKSDQIPIA